LGEILWLGHAGFRIKLGGKTIFVDPWLEGNPKSPMKPSDITEADIVCVTHDHSDHMGDAVEICRRTGATLVGIHEIGVYAEEQGVNAIGMNIGGTVDVDGIKITMVHAFHSCERGAPAGFIISDGETAIYHAGDTGLFGDMELIGRLYQPRIAMLPIGGHYTMGPREAAEAVRLIKPRVVIPMHYATFPVLEQSPDKFVELVRKLAPDVDVVALKPGEAYKF